MAICSTCRRHACDRQDRTRCAACRAKGLVKVRAFRNRHADIPLMVWARIWPSEEELHEVLTFCMEHGLTLRDCVRESVGCLMETTQQVLNEERQQEEAA